MADTLYLTARKLLFCLSAERAHEVTLKLMQLAQSVGLLEAVHPLPDACRRPVRVMGLSFPNVLGLAAGMDKEGAAVDAFGALGFGHVEVGTVTPRPQPGNPKPRLFRLVEHEAIINRMGFNNSGIEGVLGHLEMVHTFAGVLGVNLGKNADTPNERAVDDYLAGMRGFYRVADYLAVNLSSPNTKGLRDLQEIRSCEQLLSALLTERERLAQETGIRRPLAVKLAPDLSEAQVQDLADLMGRLRLDAVIVTNTTIERPGVKRHPLAHEAGGLSGAPLRELSLASLRSWRSRLDSSIPLISVGGILDGAAAVERLEAGAALLQIYTGLVYRGPALVREILEAASRWMDGRDAGASGAAGSPVKR